MAEHPHPAENPAMQAFIAQRQSDLLTRAIAVVRDCPDDALAPEAHRLAGTLGTYQLIEAHDACRDLERVALTAGATTADIATARADTLARLEQIAEDLSTPDGSEPPA
jgi:HPt (histidine-containing phosphotransfer) domain-containing protein